MYKIYLFLIEKNFIFVESMILVWFILNIDIILINCKDYIN